jgi:hypothetical protein
MQLSGDIDLSESKIVKFSIHKLGKLFIRHILLKDSFNQILKFDIQELFHRAHNISTELSHFLI